MSTYNKPSVLPAWGETNTTNADMIQPANGDIQTGFPLSATPPTRQKFNWILNFLANGLRYLMQRGLSDFDLAETYSLNSRCIGDDGITYVSLQNNNTGNLPSTHVGSFWLPWGFTLAQINASQLTQAAPPANDSTTKVPNTAWVTALVNTDTSNEAALRAAADTSETNRAEGAEGNLTNSIATTNANLATDVANLANFIAIFAYSIGASGYIKLPGGLIFQWMTGAQDTAGGSTITQSGNWPIAFPTACLAALVSTNWSSSSDSDIVSYQYQATSVNGWTLRRARGGNYTQSLNTTPTLFAIGN